MGIPGTPCGGASAGAPSDTTFTVAAALRDAVAAALVSANWSGDKLVSLGPPGVPLGTPCGADQLAVWVADGGQAKALAERPRLRLPEATFSVRFTMACWPTVELDGVQQISYPPVAEQENAAAWAYYWRCVAYQASETWVRGTAVQPDPAEGPGDYKFIAPSGGVAGWEWPVRVRLTDHRIRAVSS